MRGIAVPNQPAGPFFSRRALLQGAAAATALSALPWSIRRAYAQDAATLVIIGGGTAGMAAAIFAAARGADVIVVEKGTSLGGTLMVSGGNMGAAGTVFQKAKGIEDSAQRHYEDIMKISRGTAIPEMARLWADNAGAMVNWLAGLGLEVPPERLTIGAHYDPYSVERYHGPAMNGYSILSAMQPEFDRWVRAGRITLMTDAGAIDLIRDRNGAVNGVVVEDGDGKRSDVLGRSTIIATGGCAGNPAMFEALHGVPLYRQAAMLTSQGDGLMLGLAAGGHLRCADNYVGYYGSVAQSDQLPTAAAAELAINVLERAPWEIFVNARGERFVREDHPSMSERDTVMDRQPGHRFWAVFDQGMLEQAPPLVRRWSREQLLEAFNTHPMFHRGGTLSELGIRAGIDPAALQRTVAGYNRALQRGAADPFGRAHRPLALERGPFYAICSQTWTLKSYVGLAVDGNLRVTTEEGNAIPGLYAAGEVLGASTGGKSHTNGASVTPALTFGKLLGEKIVPV